MTFEEMQAYVRRLVDEAPPLTSEQRARLAVLLRPTNAAPGATPTAARTAA